MSRLKFTMGRILKYEYLFNGVWYECTYEAYYRKGANNYHGSIQYNPGLIRRKTFLEGNETKFQEYYLDDSLHRFDGPAIIESIGSDITYQAWFIHGEHIVDFEKFYQENSVAESIFSYIKHNSRHIKELGILAEHNKWLTENQLLLLKTMTLFK